MTPVPHLSDLTAAFLAARPDPPPRTEETLGVLYVGPWRLDVVRADDGAWQGRWVDTGAEDLGDGAVGHDLAGRRHAPHS